MGALFVDEEEVADEEGGLHGLRGDAEGLDAEGHDEDGDDDEVKEGLEARQNAGFVVKGDVRGLPRALDRAARGPFGGCLALGFRSAAGSCVQRSAPDLTSAITRPTSAMVGV